MQLISGPALPSLGGHSNPNSPGAGLPAEVSVIYPMTSSQEGLWLAYLAEPRHTAYNLTMKFSLPAKDPKFSLESLLNGQFAASRVHGSLTRPIRDPYSHRQTRNPSLYIPSRQKKTACGRVGAKRSLSLRSNNLVQFYKGVKAP
jgi:hypothetical protein